MKRENFEIDERLASQSAIRQIVNSLPGDEPSLAWRSQLNERLRALPVKARKRWWELAWKPTVGLGLATAFAFALLMRPTQPGPTLTPESGSIVADAIFDAHRGTVARHELGAVAGEALQSDTAAVPVEWDDVDLNTL